MSAIRHALSTRRADDFAAWYQEVVSAADLARQAAALVLTMRGSVCLYQGEELGLPEADIAFEELIDPRGIRFWPGDKGRDGCRTPMPWEAGAPPNGFTTGKPWLPLKHAQSALNAESQNADPNSTLNYYRQIIAWRKSQPALLTGDMVFFDTAEPILAFRRSAGNKDLICVFNLSPETRVVTLAGLVDAVPEPVSHNAQSAASGLTLGPNGFAILEVPAGEGRVDYAG